MTQPALSPAPASPTVHPARQRILQRAHDRFLAEGFHRLTMDELAADLGMSKRTLYQHFPGKIDLLNAVLDHRLSLVGRELERILSDRALDFTRRLAAVLDLLARRLAEVQPPFLRDLRRHAPESFQRVEAFRQQTIGAHFGRLLAEGRRQGMVRADLDARVVGEILLHLVQRVVTPDTVVRLGIPAAAAFATVLTVVLEGVLTPRGRAAHRPARHPRTAWNLSRP